MNDYSDVMLHPRYCLQHHAAMSETSRAAQFSAFAALAGFDEDIDETARLTDPFTARADDDIAALDAAFQKLLQKASERPKVTILYFLPDAHKEGGAYLTYTGRFRHYDAASGKLYFTDQTVIFWQNIVHIMFLL
ncbi:MAG TPA: hypothetical protein DCG49_11745 [Ruminococcus sp.]|nr:hypothetical protein [Ruminococcus sp.]